jgi:hypothetical protein
MLQFQTFSARTTLVFKLFSESFFCDWENTTVSIRKPWKVFFPPRKKLLCVWASLPPRPPPRSEERRTSPRRPHVARSSPSESDDARTNSTSGLSPTNDLLSANQSSPPVSEKRGVKRPRHRRRPKRNKSKPGGVLLTSFDCFLFFFIHWEAKRQKECRFHTAGFCRNGANCSFLHGEINRRNVTWTV